MQFAIKIFALKHWVVVEWQFINKINLVWMIYKAVIIYVKFVKDY